MTPYKQKTFPIRKGSKRRKKLPLIEAQKIIHILYARSQFRPAEPVEYWLSDLGGHPFAEPYACARSAGGSSATTAT